MLKSMLYPELMILLFIAHTWNALTDSSATSPLFKLISTESMWNELYYAIGIQTSLAHSGDPS